MAPGRDRLSPKRSILPVVLAFLGGLLVHVVDQGLNFRAGPVPVLVTAPVVAVLGYVRVRPDVTTRRLAVLTGWGFVGSGVALLGVYVFATSYQLPRPMTDPELVLYDLGLFCWFVLALTGAYVLAARTIDRYAWAAISAGPLAQFSWMPAVVFAIEVGQYV